jgi:CO/xanthine dehydrogenase Mo-binding subunit
MVEGQIEGAFVQGLGFALFEEMVWNGAQIANPTLMDYKIPTFMEAPSELHAIIVESNDPRGPYGAKSVGEIGINSVAAAITNAVNASLGVRLRRLPLTPQRVLEAMLESAPRKGARHTLAPERKTPGPVDCL